MKTIRLLLLIFAALSVACIGCSKIEDETDENRQFKTTSPPPAISINSGYTKTWIENFAYPATLENNWLLFGNKVMPSWTYSANGELGLFDNNGPSPLKNFGVSNTMIGKGKGYTVEGELMLIIKNPAGTCVCPGIAVSQDQNPVLNGDNEIPTCISMRLVFAGINATWFPAKVRNHTSIIMEFISETGNVVSSGFLPADMYSNDWHKLKIQVTDSRYIKFYCDNTLIWAPFIRLHPLYMSDRRVVLGYTSDGNPNTRAGIAYHNWIKTSYVVPPESE